MNKIGPKAPLSPSALDTQFQRARDQLEESHSPDSLRATLEREYQLFTESINEWTALQSQRYEAKKAEIGGALNEKKARLQQKWESAALRTKFKELEYSLNVITGFAATSLQPNSGAQGEYAGLADRSG